MAEAPNETASLESAAVPGMSHLIVQAAETDLLPRGGLDPTMQELECEWECNVHYGPPAQHLRATCIMHGYPIISHMSYL